MMRVDDLVAGALAAAPPALPARTRVCANTAVCEAQGAPQPEEVFLRDEGGFYRRCLGCRTRMRVLPDYRARWKASVQREAQGKRRNRQLERQVHIERNARLRSAKRVEVLEARLKAHGIGVL